MIAAKASGIQPLDPKMLPLKITSQSSCKPEEAENEAEAHVTTKAQHFYPNQSMTTKQVNSRRADPLKETKLMKTTEKAMLLNQRFKKKTVVCIWNVVLCCQQRWVRQRGICKVLIAK